MIPSLTRCSERLVPHPGSAYPVASARRPSTATRCPLGRTVERGCDTMARCRFRVVCAVCGVSLLGLPLLRDSVGTAGREPSTFRPERYDNWGNLRRCGF